MSATDQHHEETSVLVATPGQAASPQTGGRTGSPTDRLQELGGFLRIRREALPAEARHRRRTPGLRREDIAFRSHISVDYYTRLEQGRAASMPSVTVTDALADALRLTSVERAHLHRLAGRAAPEIIVAEEPASNLLFTLDRLETTPGQILTDLGGVLAQNLAADALFSWVCEEGLGTANVYERWFCHAGTRRVCPAEHRSDYSDLQAGELRAAVTRRELAGDHRGHALVEELTRRSAEFRRAWAAHRVNASRHKQIWIADGAFDVHTTIDEQTSQRLVVFDPVPRRES